MGKWGKVLKILMLSAVMQVHAAEPETLTRLTLYTEHFPPYSYQQGSEITGINAEIVKRLCQDVGIECPMQLFPWLRAYENARQDPHSGVFSTVRTPTRAADFQWVGPLASSRSFLYRLKSRPEVAPQNLEQVKNYGIAVARGDVYEEYLLANGFVRGQNLLDFPSKTAPIALFLQGKVDLIIGSELVMPSWLAANQASIDLVEPVLALEVKGQNYLALKPAVPLSVVQRLQQALDAMKASGEYQRIVARLFVAPSPELYKNKAPAGG